MKAESVNRVYTIKKSARVSFNRAPSSSVKTLWFVLHGYGHLSPFFIKKFKSLAEDETVLLVCPEGLHRYYLDGFSGRVGVSWMTKEERLLDIEDNLNYLGQLYEQVITELKGLGVVPEQINVLGFSQGGATACRWVCTGNYPVDRLILYASVFPPDLEIDVSTLNMQGIKTIIAVGNEDEFISVEEATSQYEKFKKVIKNLDLLVFEGKHQVYDHVLLKIK